MSQHRRNMLVGDSCDAHTLTSCRCLEVSSPTLVEQQPVPAVKPRVPSLYHKRSWNMSLDNRSEL
jgi:hypothetical protein